MSLGNDKDGDNPSDGGAPVRRPQPWALASAAALAQVVGLMTDIDDTLTCEGAIEPVALQALHDLRAAGLPVVAITGRPMGWSLPFARAWPVAAIVAENGAVALMRDGDSVRTEYTQDEALRQHNSRRLQAVAQRILHDVPGTTLATDSAGRVTDIAIDHAEFARLGPDSIAKVVTLMQAEGMNATVSSIHVNGWFGEHTKWSGAVWMAQRLFGRAVEPDIARWVYVGDSTNDQLMFANFPLSVGVANLRHFADRLQTWPAYITDGERGLGFAEVVRAVLAARNSVHAEEGAQAR